MLLAVTVFAVLLLTVALPSWKVKTADYDPAADAQAAYRSLQEQIGPSETRSGASGSVDPDALLGPDGGQRRPLQRSLFTPVKRVFPPKPKSRDDSSRGPRLPTLSGVLIDGDSKKAVIAGKMVAPGDSVNGFLVVDIEPDGVLLERNGLQHRISLRGKP
jgi:hypothetical protein